MDFNFNNSCNYIIHNYNQRRLSFFSSARTYKIYCMDNHSIFYNICTFDRTEPY